MGQPFHEMRCEHEVDPAHLAAVEAFVQRCVGKRLRGRVDPFELSQLWILIDIATVQERERLLRPQRIVRHELHLVRRLPHPALRPYVHHPLLLGLRGEERRGISNTTQLTLIPACASTPEYTSR